jgi:hypothetical protein
MEPKIIWQGEASRIEGMQLRIVAVPKHEEAQPDVVDAWTYVLGRCFGADSMGIPIWKEARPGDPDYSYYWEDIHDLWDLNNKELTRLLSLVRA